MRNPWERRPKTWDEVWERAKSPKVFPQLIMAFLIAGMLGFNPWVLFGMSFWVFGALGLNEPKRKYKEFYEEEQEYWQKKQNDSFVPEVKTIENQQAITPVSKILDDADDDIDAIKAASHVASGELGDNLREMANVLDKCTQDLKKHPEKFSQVQRLFTYYVPSTNTLIKARGKAASIGDNVKIAEIDNMIGRLKLAYQEFAAKMNGEDSRSVDIDLKLLEQSLAQDLPLEMRIKDKI